MYRNFKSAIFRGGVAPLVVLVVKMIELMPWLPDLGSNQGPND